MNKYLSFIASATFLFSILSYDAMTNVFQRVQDGTIVPRVRSIHTNERTGEFYQASFNANMGVLKNQYSNAYLCASKIDESKCKKPMAK